MPLLSEEEYLATFTPRMERCMSDEEPPLDFWPYFDTIPEADFLGNQCAGDVTYVYRDASARFEHILVDTTERNTFMVIIVDLSSKAIVGHRLLDLNAEYGLNERSDCARGA